MVRIVGATVNVSKQEHPFDGVRQGLRVCGLFIALVLKERGGRSPGALGANQGPLLSNTIVLTGDRLADLLVIRRSGESGGGRNRQPECLSTSSEKGAEG
jgi:hypothetical protein